ncbi:MAG: bifunctional acetaldehyde-CoA/alcohol dehydrogenase [Spirochaetales bacterium]
MATTTTSKPAAEQQQDDGAKRESFDLDALITKVSSAQASFATFTQEQVDEIFRRAAMAANTARIDLAEAAVEETGMGVLEDKVIKNHFAAEFIFNKYKDTATCGVVERDEAGGIAKIAEPIGVIAGVIPTTNPTSTAIFKALLALKTRNAIIFSPHPRAKRCTVEAARIIRDAAVEAGAPQDIIGWIPEPSVELTNALMRHPSVNLILATGGPGMVKAAYSSGKPALGVGAGNTPAVIDETADIKMAVSSILMSKSFDNGMICASEQSLIVVDERYEAVKEELALRGAHLCTKKESDLLRKLVVVDGKLNAKIVGQPAAKIAEMAGFTVPPARRVLVAPVEKVGENEPLSYEKLSPVLALYKRADYDEAVATAVELVAFGGIGHTSVLYTDPSNAERIEAFGRLLKTGRVLINMPTSQGAIGDIYNFRLEPSLTLGCGSWGGNSVSENVGVKHLLNTKTVAERRENMLWFRLPPRVYLKAGSLDLALRELAGKKRAVIVTDAKLMELGYTDRVTRVTDELGIDTEIFYQVEPDPTLATINRGVELMRSFSPDVVIALGGGSPIDAAKIMWLLYERPEITFEGLAMRFMDIRKRIYALPELGRKATMVAIPTTSGTGSEVTPFAVVTDERTGVKYPLADYELTPDMAIVDSQLVASMPARLTAYSGIDALTHALEAVVSVLSTDYTNGMALEAIRILFKYLPQAYRDGARNARAREKVHNAATMAGMAFANAFLGICHSMAHKLGAAFNLPHGLANALMIGGVIDYNCADAPTKQTAFSQYTHPDAKARYARVADYLNLGGTSAEEKVKLLQEAIVRLKEELDMPATIAEAGVAEIDFLTKVDDLAKNAFDDQCTGANPRYPLVSELKELYLAAFYGRDKE